MILNGKAKEDFEMWVNNTHDDNGNGQIGKRLFYIESIDDYKFINTEHYIHNTGESMLYALIIQWLDSVGISLQIGTCPNGFTEDEKPIYYYDWQIYAVYNCCSSDEEFDNRQEATRQAIIVANEIYNYNEKNN